MDFFDAARHRGLRFLHIKGLCQIIHRLIAQGLGGVIEIRVAGEKDELAGIVPLTRIADDVQPRAHGHFDVAKHELRLFFIEKRAGRVGVAGDEHLIHGKQLPVQRIADHLRGGDIVVDDQDTHALSPPCAALSGIQIVTRAPPCSQLPSCSRSSRP